VKRAVERGRAEAREEKQHRGRAFDEIWCVFDHDNHPDLNAALGLARNAGIKVAFSNPCIELWFILHFQDQRAWISGPDARRLSRTLLGCSKVLDGQALETLVTRYGDAAERAKALLGMHRANGSPDNENPSSGVWELVESIKR